MLAVCKLVCLTEIVKQCTIRAWKTSTKLYAYYTKSEKPSLSTKNAYVPTLLLYKHLRFLELSFFMRSKFLNQNIFPVPSNILLILLCVYQARRRIRL